jgi:membrane protein implicated in regulation of membrane protease activity
VEYLWIIWFGVAIIFFIIEMLNMTFYIICLGVGALAASAAAALALLDKDNNYIWAQLAAFAVGTFVSFAILQPLARRLKKQGTRYRTNIEAIFDEIGIVIKDIGPDGKEGRIKVRGTSWRAVSTTNEVIPTQERVEILKIDGTKLYVQAIKEKEKLL